MIDLTPSPSRLLKASAAAVRWLFWLLAAACLLLALVWGTLHGWIVPRIGEFRPRLETAVSRALGVPVRVGGITAQSTGLIPSFELTDVSLLDPQGREALRLPRVLAALSPRSLIGLGFEQLYIDRPELDIRRTASGRIQVAGLDFSSEDASDGSAADWFFSQTEFVIRNGMVRWTDELRKAAPLALRQVDFVVRNGTRRHDLRLDATPPADWGDRFSVVARFRQPLLSRHGGQWRHWDGQVYADFARVDVSQLRRYADLGIDIGGGSGALRGWADVRQGRATGGTADVALAGVEAVLGPQLAPLALQSVAGRLGGRLLASGFEFSTQGLQFTTREGLRWPGGNVSLTYTRAEGRAPERGEFRADRLDLAALAQIGQRLPLGTATHAALSAYSPQGLVETVQASWQGPLEAIARFDARGRVTRLALAAQPVPSVPGTTATQATPGRPGIRGAALDFDLTQSGGKAKLAIERGALDLPGVFDEPVLPLDRLSADVQWQLAGEQIGVQLANVTFANADAQGEFQASWKTSDPVKSAGRSRFPGVLDLQGSLSRGDGARVHRYLPLTLTPEVRGYVREAVTQGAITEARFKVRGDLHDLPFANPKLGDFHIAGKVRDVTYAFVPASIQPREARPWPALTQLAGELVFDRSAMQIKGASGRLTGGAGLQVTKAEAQIADLAKATVVVSAEARGPLGEMLRVVAASPLDAMTGQALTTATATGNADLRLRLALPIQAINTSKVQGSVTLAGNDVQLSPDTPLLARARGVVAFSDSGFALTGVQARALGGDLRLEGGMRVVPGVETVPLIRAQGSFTAEALQQAHELGFLSRLARHASGGAAYTATLGFRRGVAELSLASSLQGLALQLPAPLAKSAEATLPLRFEKTLLRDTAAAGNGPLRDQLLLELGRLGSAVYVRELDGPQVRVVRGSIGVGLLAGESAPLPGDGVVANINLASADLDAWETVLTQAAGAAASAEATSAASSYLPTSIAVRARELTVQGRKLNNVVVGGSREGLTWRANLEARELNGYGEYRQASGAGAGRIYARLARLNIAPSAATEVEALLDDQSTSVPALDIVVDDLELRGKKLGRVEVEAVNLGAGAAAREVGVREWRLNKLNVLLPEASFSATGNWAAAPAQSVTAGSPRLPRPPGERRRTVMNFRLDIGDSGELLTRFGMKEVVRGGKGRMEGQVAWLGSPLTLDYTTMNGQFNVNVETGQFLKADPGLAKLLGVLSLQSLPRRLTLDFRDVFSEGFAFDFVRGDIRIEQGIALTNNLQMKGVNAAVLMDGRADIARETQDLRVVVVPEINAGTASLVATVINPAIGLGSFLAQIFLRRPLIQAATQEFHVDGTWTDPKVTKVEPQAAPADSKPEARTGSRPGATP